MKHRRSDQGKTKRQRERRADAKHLRALSRLENERTLFEPAAVRVVQAALERAGVDGSDGLVVEIGAGGGQLRRWLPVRLLQRIVHTEPEAAFVRKFQQAVPEATVKVASAESLPYADASVTAVIGLCVLDVVDLEAVAKELHRVLEPGGSVVHFWDLAPNMQWRCERAIREGHVLLPDCFSDPRVLSELPTELRATLPPLDFLQDLMSVPRHQLERLIALLLPRPTRLIDGSALERLAGYVERFSSTPTDGAETLRAAGAEAAKALAWLCDDEGETYACKRLMLNAWLMLKQARGGAKLPLELTRISSAEALSERLIGTFSALGMQVDCAVRRARAHVARPPANRNPKGELLNRARFAGRWLGTNALAAAVPPADPEILAADPAPLQDERDRIVVEAGILVLTARRVD